VYPTGEIDVCENLDIVHFWWLVVRPHLRNRMCHHTSGMEVHGATARSKKQFRERIARSSLEIARLVKSFFLQRVDRLAWAGGHAGEELSPFWASCVGYRNRC
jgi:hypothetical protein